MTVLATRMAVKVQVGESRVSYLEGGSWITKAFQAIN